MAKAPFVYPILGGRKVEHLMANLEALDITLTDQHIAYLETILPFDKGFPNKFIVCFMLKSTTLCLFSL